MKRSLTPPSTRRTTGSPISRQDMLEIIAALILNASPCSDRSVRSKRYTRGLRLWSTLLSIVPEYEGATIEQASARWPVTLRRRFLSALYYRIRRRWPFTPYRAARYLCKPVERTDIATVYRLRSTSTVQTPVPQTATCLPSDTQRAVRDRKSTRLNSSHSGESRMPSSA